MARGRKPGIRWDALELAPVVLISAGEDVIGEQASDRLVSMALERDPEPRLPSWTPLPTPRVAYPCWPAHRCSEKRALSSSPTASR